MKKPRHVNRYTDSSKPKHYLGNKDKKLFKKSSAKKPRDIYSEDYEELNIISNIFSEEFENSKLKSANEDIKTYRREKRNAALSSFYKFLKLRFKSRRAYQHEYKRFTARARRKRFFVFSGVLLTVMVFASSIAMAYSPIMYLKKIELVGVQNLDTNSFNNDLAEYVDKPIVNFTEENIKEIVEKYPVISSYSVVLEPPDKSIINIIERKAVAIVANESGFSLIDPAAIKVADVETLPDNLPLIKGVDINSGSEIFNEIIRVIRILPPDFISQIREISASSISNISILMKNNINVSWGDSKQSLYKMQVYTQLLNSLGYGRFSYLNVSSVEAPFFR